jgi:tetratricopeptide (TPR) repeat protein
MESGQQEQDKLRQQWASLMQQANSLHEAENYQEAIVKGEAALALIDNLSTFSTRDQFFTLQKIIGLYKEQRLYESIEALQEYVKILHERAKWDEKFYFSQISVLIRFARPRRVCPTFSPFCKKLIRWGCVNAEQLNQALVESRTSNTSLMDVLESITGERLPIEVRKAYRKQQLFELKIVYGIDAIDIESTKISTVEIRVLIDNFISLHSCRQLKLLPIGIIDSNPPVLKVATIDPAALQTKDYLDKILAPHNIKWRAKVIAPEDYQQILNDIDDRKPEDTDTTLCKQALSYISQGQLKRALEIREELLGTEYSDVYKIRLDPVLLSSAQKLYDRALSHHNQRQYDLAEEQYKCALEIRKKLLGTEHPDVADILHKLALVYAVQGQLKRALEIREELLGTEYSDAYKTRLDPVLLSSAQKLYDLASSHCERGQDDLAEPLYKYALEIREKLLGTEHRDVANILNRLALLYGRQELYERASEFWGKFLSTEWSDHFKFDLDSPLRSFVQQLYKAAFLALQGGQDDRAEALYKFALVIREKLSGTERPDVADIHLDLALVYVVQGLYDRAKPLFDRALEIREKLLGTEHPNVDNIRLDLALVHVAQGLDERAKTDEEHLFIDPTQSAINRLLIAHSEFFIVQKKLVHTGYVNAEQINQVLIDRRQTNRESAIAVAVSPHDRRQYDRAKPLYERALESREKSQVLMVRADFLPPSANKLIQCSYVNAEQLKQALVESRASNTSLVDVLEYTTGKRLPVEARKAYKKQRLFELKIVYGIDVVDIESTQISTAGIRALIDKFISFDNCCQLKLLPIGITDSNPPVLTVAMLDPADLQAKYELDKILDPHNIEWQAKVISSEDYQQLIDDYQQFINDYQQFINDEFNDRIQRNDLAQRWETTGVILYELAVSYKEQGLYDRAELLYERALEVWEKLLGQGHSDVTIIQLDLALVYTALGFYNQAESLYERALEILGTEHPDVADILLKLALIYEKQEQYDRAEQLYQRVLEIREELLGTEHLDVAFALCNLAGLYEKQEVYDRAEQLYQRVLEIREELLGTEHLDVADILLNLGLIYKKQGLYDRAKSLYQRVLEIREELLGAEHLDVAFALCNLADLYEKQEQYSRAKQLYERALEIQLKSPDKEHLDVAMTLNKLAELCWQQGFYERSQTLHERVLAIREKALGKEHLDLAITLNELAFLAKQQGLFTRAESLYRRALSIQEKALGQEHSNTAKTLHGLAGLYQRQGLYERAEPLYQQTLQISKAVLGTEHPDIAAIFHGWASLYKEQGLYEQAEPLYERALEISKKTLGEKHPHVVATLHHLAGLYQSQGLYDRAESLYLEDLEISKKTLGDDHIDVATTMHHLADLYQVQGLSERAEPDYLRALAIREKALGKKHPDVATTLNGLAGLYQARGAYNDAEPRCKRALEIQETILGKKHPDVANTLDNLAGLYRAQGLYSMSEPLYKRALGIKETALGQDHPSVATTLHHLAAMYREQGHYDRALAHFQTALESQYNFIRKRLAHISEREHKLYLKDLKRTLTALLSLVYRHLNTDQSAIAIALNAVLLTKNLSAAALAARNASVHSGNPLLQNKIQQIRELIAQSNHIAHDDPQQIQISEQMRALEIQIARIAPEVMLPDALEIDRQAITQKLTLDRTLVEFIGFDPENSTRYLAFVYSPSRSNRIRLIDLGLASEIDSLIANCRRSILDIYHKLVKTAGSEIPDEIQEFPIESLEPVKARIIEPLQLDRVAHVIIAPDGALSFLPFQLFLPDSLVSYLNTGRDLVIKPSQKPVGDSIVIADPDFVNKPTDLYLVPSKPQIERDGMLAAGVKDLNNWIPLDSFGILGTAIAAKLQVACHQQRSATKARLTQSQCPHILSILTHGFALPKTDVEELDPMARSGLAFAGANHGTEYLLLANEVATLDLHNNELTLLVACQTALGDVTTGEGVYGLRRAFALAGAKTLIATLWEIPVYASVILIERFLDNLERSMGKAAALKEAQMYLRDIDAATLDRIPNGAGIDALTELHGKNYDLDDAFQPFSHPYFWAAWICQGDTGAMKYVIAKDLSKFKIGGKVINLRIQK